MSLKPEKKGYTWNKNHREYESIYTTERKIFQRTYQKEKLYPIYNKTEWFISWLSLTHH